MSHVQTQECFREYHFWGLLIRASKDASPSTPLLTLGFPKAPFQLHGSLLPTRIWSHHLFLKTVLRKRLS